MLRGFKGDIEMASTTSKIKKVKPIGGVHGVSAVFPTFKDIIDYEEEKVILNRGYPRFVTHPFVRKTEEYYKEKFLANEVLCCQSFEASLFLIIDYYLKKDVKIFTNHKLSKKFIHYFKRKFPNLIEEVNTPTKANILLAKEEQFNQFKKNSKKNHHWYY